MSGCGNSSANTSLLSWAIDGDFVNIFLGAEIVCKIHKDQAPALILDLVRILKG